MVSVVPYALGYRYFIIFDVSVKVYGGKMLADECLLVSHAAVRGALGQ